MPGIVPDPRNEAKSVPSGADSSSGEQVRGRAKGLRWRGVTIERNRQI